MHVELQFQESTELRVSPRAIRTCKNRYFEAESPIWYRNLPYIVLFEGFLGFRRGQKRSPKRKRYKGATKGPSPGTGCLFLDPKGDQRPPKWLPKWSQNRIKIDLKSHQKSIPVFYRFEGRFLLILEAEMEHFCWIRIEGNILID